MILVCYSIEFPDLRSAFLNYEFPITLNNLFDASFIIRKKRKENFCGVKSIISYETTSLIVNFLENKKKYIAWCFCEPGTLWL